MKRYLYNNQHYSMRSLSDVTGISYTTLVERFKRGYTVEEAASQNSRIPESVLEFDNASDYKVWDGLINEDFYKIYCKWCYKTNFTPESNVHFTRCIRQLHPNIRVVPTRLKQNGNVIYKRVVRVAK